MTRVNNPTDDLQRVTYPRCLPPRIHYLLSRHTYVRNRLRTPFVSILSLRLVSIAARSSKNSNDHPLEGKDSFKRPESGPTILRSFSPRNRPTNRFFIITVFNFSNETQLVRKKIISYTCSGGRGSFRFFETEFAEAGYRFGKNDHPRPVLHANYGKTEERRVHGPILRPNSTGSAERIFACTAFTVSPRCKSTVITMSLHHVTRIRSSNFCFCECASHVRACTETRVESSRIHPRSLRVPISSSSFETR